jgi:hypothetical protein
LVAHEPNSTPVGIRTTDGDHAQNVSQDLAQTERFSVMIRDGYDAVQKSGQKGTRQIRVILYAKGTASRREPHVTHSRCGNSFLSSTLWSIVKPNPVGTNSVLSSRTTNVTSIAAPSWRVSETSPGLVQIFIQTLDRITRSVLLNGTKEPSSKSPSEVYEIQPANN